MSRRVVDLPLESLPFVDEHSIVIAASPDQVWDALLETVGDFTGDRGGSRIAGALGCEQTDRAGKPGRIGSTVPGFVVTRSVRPAVLALMGAHRFARYALVFQISETPLEPVILSAVTRAEFPGRRGRAYRLAVIGTRGHVVVLRSVLHTVRKKAERAVAGAALAGNSPTSEGR
ncbi:MAG TPA: hypothetical protein VHF58_04960 [Solirubrobacterales bacterium]|nr:hypothetical protein [Solirubrobacterales bacterium]